MTTYSDNEPTTPGWESISAPSDLIAAVPAFLGFHPHRSLVLICLDDDTGNVATSVGTVMRHDLILPSPDGLRSPQWTVTQQMADVIEQFADVCGRYGVRNALGLIVDDRVRNAPDAARHRPLLRAVARRLTEELNNRGTALPQVYCAPDISYGRRWTTVAGPSDSGIISDPETSPVALAYLLDGRGVHDSRARLKEELTHTDTQLTAEVVERLKDARTVDISDRVRLDAIVSQLLEWAVYPEDRPAVVELSADVIAEFGVSLRNVMVRDSLLALPLTGFADLAERLWRLLTRTLPAPERAAAAALLGFTAYARGDGAVATVAIDLALDTDPDYSLATLLDRSIRTGARPAMIREVARSGYSVAELCGVRLPPPLS